MVHDIVTGIAFRSGLLHEPWLLTAEIVSGCSTRTPHIGAGMVLDTVVGSRFDLLRELWKLVLKFM